MTKQYCLLLLVIHWISLIYCIEKISSTKIPRLLIISLDGFCHNYLSKYSLPTFNRIQKQGIKTKYGMEPTFATLTFPNHISIATGMYQEDHGIIYNKFYDTELQKVITFGTRDEGQWSPKVEPIWITATKQNKQAAVLYWPASHNEFHGIRPLAYTSQYSDVITFREKINNSISYFRESSIQLIMTYHYEPDRQGHLYGPDAQETQDALLRLDGDIDYLLTRVKNELNDDLNIIILSDHGMTNTKRVIQPFLDGYINKSLVEDNILDGPLLSVTPRPGKFQQVFNGLRRIPDATVYPRHEFPEKYHYAKAIHRLGEIIVLPNYDDMFFSQALSKTIVSKGNHGYDNKLPSMQAIFMAQGPDFNQHMEIDSLKNVDVYHIACRILNLKPNPYATAGSLDSLTNIFRIRNESHYNSTKVSPIRTSQCSQSFLDRSVFLFLVFLNLILRF